MSEQPSEAHSEMTAHASTDEPGDHDALDLTDSDIDTAGGMGVSSEREGPTGPGQHGTSGVREVGPAEPVSADDVAPEQSSGGPETNPAAMGRKSAYPSADPRSEGEDPSRPRAEREIDRRPDAD
jgi:hypothetical protein